LMNEEPRTEFPNPYSEYSPMVQEVKVVSNGSTNRDLWDVHYNYPCGFASGEAGTESDGQFIYTTQWNAGNGTFYKYDLGGTFLGPFTVSGCQDIRDLAYDPTTGLMFGSNATNTVWGMNFVTGAVDMTISAPTAARAIAYDNDNDGFWANNWDTPITLFDKTGATITSINVGAFGSLYGLAYDNWADGGPYLWAFSQAGSGAELVQYDLATGTEIFNMNTLPLLGGTQIAGGLYTHCNLFGNNTVTIGGILQNELIFGFEWVQCSSTPGPTPGGEIPENLIGYNLYRDMEVVAYVPYIDGDSTTHYYDLGLEPLTYQYDVSALYDLEPYGFPGDTGESALEGSAFVTIRYGHPLPFNEPWISGTFDLNQWSHEGNWRVNGQVGAPEPSAEFTWDPILTDYRSALTSYPIDGYGIDNPYIDGCIWFDYDVRLDDRNMTGDETLVVEVGNENGWHKVAEYSNANGSFDWTGEHFDITSWAFGQIFRVRFIAEGMNSNDLQSWFVDNINVYRLCNEPYDLDFAVDYPSLTEGEVTLTWHSPAPCAGGGPGPGGEWIFWDNGEHEGGIGLTGGGVFSVASHWDADMLTQYDGMSITKITFIPYVNALTTTFELKVWEGPNAGTLLHSQAVSGLLLGEWNEITLTTPVPIDVTKELWFGYTVDSPDGENPAGYDIGPAVAGYGDMITLDGVQWDPLSSFGAQFDRNWNLRAYVAGTDGDAVALTPKADNTVYPTPNASLSMEKGEGIVAAPANSSRFLQGYNVYRDGEFLAFTTDTTYTDVVTELGLVEWTYNVEAVYEDCVSAAIEGVVSTTVSISELTSEGIAIYPNPATDVVNITATEDITFVTIMNNVGQVVYNNKVVNDNMLQVTTTGYEAGVYMIKVETENNVIIKKVVIAQ
ncbi:MAG: T9SS type A sorting domain-containing protein, partial [Bacteroidetes bacterium]|nr:T9SS type A sorting domain-containing protein [Bacteroidota bacterium]